MVRLQNEAFNTYLLTVIALTMAFFIPTEGIEPIAIAGFGAIAAGAFCLRNWSAFYLSLVFLLRYVYLLFIPPVVAQFPVHSLLVPVVLATCVISFFDKASLAWIVKGQLESATVKWMVSITVFSITGLLIWAQWTSQNGYGETLIKDLRTLPLWLVAGIGVPVFALFMALAEEVLYRGIMLQAFGQLTNSWWAPQLIQATVYGAFHYASAFPNGKIGFIMVFTYGIILGELRKKSGGLLAPYLVHVSTDLVIGYYLLWRFF